MAPDPVAAARPRDAARLAELMPILRCPETGLPLDRAGDSELVSRDASRRWPIVSGRPCLFPGLGKPVDHGDHLSNPICEDAERIIAAADGLVLNLSAGGTRRWRPNVVEVEAGIFRNTDLLADVHSLPFVDNAFAAVVALNAFEHYRDPFAAAREIRRVLKPGGTLFIHTAFLQPLHEPPWHFFNATRYGILEWFRDFETVRIGVSENFNPVHTVSWIAAEVERMVREHLSPAEADRLMRGTLADYARMWNDPGQRATPLWRSFFGVPPGAQEGLAAGFEYVGRRKPD
jgi:SAM-dependent methyltransferase